MRISRPEKKTVIEILVKRTVTFFFGMCLLTILLYGIGTAQGFMDITQLLLLRLTVVLGLFLGVGSVYGIILALWLAWKGVRKGAQKGALGGLRFRHIGGIGGYLLLGLFGMLVALMGAFILVTAGGNGI
jgi:hypothetical protein